MAQSTPKITAKYAVAAFAAVLLAGSYMVADLQSITGNARIASVGEFIADYSLLTEIRVKKAHQRLLNAKLVRNRSLKKHSTEERGRLGVVWLLAYPFAGSNVALKIFEDNTGLSMGTNYGHIVMTEKGYKENHYTSEPLNANEPNGPFRFDMDRPLPSSGNVLVKTHCGGHCFDMVEECMAKPISLAIWSLRQFLTECGSGTTYKIGGKKSLVSYNFYKSQKTMVLVRHPLEIVFARFVDYMKRPTTTTDYMWNHAGIEEYCKDYDSLPSALPLMTGYDNPEAIAMAEKGEVLCHAELYKITRFYNNAFKAVAFMQEPAHVVHFEDYSTDLGGTIQGMMNFMEYKMPEAARSRSFNRTGTDDHAWFSTDEAGAMMKFVDLIASDATREAFASYM